MHWNSFAEFLAMGNHALYVWGSVVVMAVMMLAEPMLLMRGRKTLVARLKRQLRAEQAETLANCSASRQSRRNTPQE
ncbi:heme exporter protein CcmD [Accumulibacter sp.]|uniref:heme exporter protein CcmD n=1 Tax=Accumulibacter sp. TaxID=2053492 RepID=UPI0035B18A6B